MRRALTLLENKISEALEALEAYLPALGVYSGDLPQYARAFELAAELSGMPECVKNVDLRSALERARSALKQSDAARKQFDLTSPLFLESIAEFDVEAWRSSFEEILEALGALPYYSAATAFAFVDHRQAIINEVIRASSVCAAIVAHFDKIGQLTGETFSLDRNGLSRISELLDTVESGVIVPACMYDPDLKEACALCAEAKKEAEELFALKSRLFSVCREEILEIDDGSILARYENEYTGLFRFLRGDYRRDRALLTSFCRTPQKKIGDDEAKRILHLAGAVKEKDAWFARNGERFKKLFSETYYSGPSSDFDAIRAALDTAAAVKELTGARPSSILVKLFSDRKRTFFASELKSEIRAIFDGYAALREVSAPVSGILFMQRLPDDLTDFSNALTQYKTMLQRVETQMRSLTPHLTATGAQLNARDLRQALETYLGARALSTSLRNNADVFRHVFGDLYDGDGTDWPAVVETLERWQEFSGLPVFARTLRLTALPDDERAGLKAASKKISDAYAVFAEEEKHFVLQFSPESGVARFDLPERREHLRACLDAIGDLEGWIDYREAKKRCAEAGLESFIAEVEQRRLFKDASGIFEKAFFTKWCEEVVASRDALSSFRKNDREEKIARFCRLDDDRLNIARARIREKLALPPEVRFFNVSDEMAILRKERDKRARFMPLRKLFSSIPTLLTRLKPCLMMSPLTVSYFLESSAYQFDLVIFDEASQIFPQDAIGAILRGKQIIIAGDPKQLPPTSFFTRMNADNGADPDAEDEEEPEERPASILEEALNAAPALPDVSLGWHYRSRFESLIAFSNNAFYKGELITFPNCVQDERDAGVEYCYVPDGVYSPGAGQRFNLMEARECVRLVADHIDRFPDRSLGIIAFSIRQQSMIEDEINAFREAHGEYEWFFDENRDEPFFIKNLENVQGDERDTIIFSICYGRDPSGTMCLNFGPLSREGGERRLNVAVTRAKMNVKLVGSVLPEDIDTTRAKSEGARLLRAYIEFARNRNGEQSRRYGKREDETRDLFCDSVAQYLEECGYTVKRNVGTSDYTVDVAVVDPNCPDRFIAGVECDGPIYRQACTAADRDHLRAAVLGRMGWTLYRVWSIEWFKNPQRERASIKRFLDDLINGGADGRQIDFPDGDAPSGIERFTEEESDDGGKSALDFPVYTPATFDGLPNKRLGDSQNRIAENILYVVTTEGPVHTDLLMRILSECYASRTMTERRRASINMALYNTLRSQVTVDRFGFISLSGESTVRARVPAPGARPRPIEYVHHLEIEDSLKTLLALSIGIREDSLIAGCAKVFGYEHKGRNITAKIRLALDDLEAEGTIRREGEKVFLTACAD